MTVKELIAPNLRTSFFTFQQGMLIGLEFDYLHIDQTLARNPGQVATALPVGISKNPDAFEARLRIERDF